MTPELIKAIKQLDEYSKQARFLGRYKIETDEQLVEFEKSTYRIIKLLKSERENLWRAYKRVKTEDEKKVIEDMIIDISKQITPVAEELRICRCIMKKSEEIRKVELHKQLENDRQKALKEMNKDKERCR